MENVPTGVFAFYPRGWSFQVATFDPDLQLRAGEIRVLRRTRAERAAAFGRGPWRYSLTAGLVWTLLDRPLARAVAELEAALVADSTTAEPSYRVTGPRKTYRRVEDLYAELAAVWKRCSEQMAHLSRGNGAVYLHFLQPNQYVPDSKRFSADELARAVVENSADGQLVRAVYPMLQAHGRDLRKHGVRFLDLTGLFERETETIYVDSCCHVNARGTEMIMREVTRELASALP